MEDNKLIAEFMELPTEVSKEGLLNYYHRKYNSGTWYEEHELSYEVSWEWLMPVVKKIERKHKANFRTECLWNEFIECSIYQVIVSIEQGEMSKDKSCIYDSKKIYWYIGDSVKCKREATYKAVVEFIKTYNHGGM
tara:strand:+ start:455 stop:862 length:408 start_codon:yes stop_codon:yes gene_type:complete